MPRRDDISSILVLGSGPIVIGQACEFDYSGTQACRVLRREGYRVVLVNSNPATIMTDPELADATYVEPLVPEAVERILEKERPDALLPTVGGQTGINLALALDESGALERYGVELLGANVDALKLGEDRLLFKQAMEGEGLEVPRSGYAGSLSETREIVEDVGYPVIIRPSFTLGGEGGGVAYNHEELEEVAAAALLASPAHRILVEQSVLGWKEFEFEVMRDLADKRHRRLLGRELRRHGRSHRRLDHGRAAADAVGRRVPGDAGRLVPRDPPRRGGDRRVEHSVRGRPGHRPAGGDRDEPPGVA